MLFECDSANDSPSAPAAQAAAGVPRLRVPQRDQVEMRCASLDELLESDHRARIVWEVVGRLDLGHWLAGIKAVEGNVGRHATDPRLLVALWVLATLDGIGSAREVERLSEKHLAYQWLCGGVSVNYHMLSDFRSQNGAAWDELLTQIVAALLNEGLVTMERVAQDGMRVRAGAGKSSFRSGERLEMFQEQAREQVETLKRLAEENPDELSNRQRSARERAARERLERIEGAMENCARLQRQRDERSEKSGEPAKNARASTTDPESRVMQFSDGGYRPGYNVQFATDVASGVILGVDAANAGTDSEQLAPMLDQIQQRYGRMPDEALVDGGFTTKGSIRAAAARECVVFGPLKEEQKQLDAGKNPYVKKRGDCQALADWRVRMGTDAAKAIYRLRAQTAEWVNAQARNRGFRQMPVRGQPKCRAVATLYAVTHNLMQGLRLRTQAAAAGG